MYVMICIWLAGYLPLTLICLLVIVETRARVVESR